MSMQFAKDTAYASTAGKQAFWERRSLKEVPDLHGSSCETNKQSMLA